MKKIIGGRVYDTSTATLIHEHWNGLGRGDFMNCREFLYRKKRTREFFVYGRGGGSSRWRENASGSGGWREGEGILPLTDAEALEWAETHEMDADYILHLWRDSVEDVSYLDDDLRFFLEDQLSGAMGILDPLLKIGSKVPRTKKTLREVRAMIWTIEAVLVDEGLIYTDEEGEE